jgi:hypothetical protein
MKNIFKTANSKLFLLFLITFLSNLSYGQTSYQQAIKANVPGAYFVSNPRYNHDSSRTSGAGVSEYQEYDQYGNVYYYAVNWDNPNQNFQGEAGFDYGTQYEDDNGYDWFLANRGTNPEWDQVSMEKLVAGIMKEVSYYEDPFFHQQDSKVPSLLGIADFIMKSLNDTTGQTKFVLGIDQSGVSFVPENSATLVKGYYDAAGKFIDYKNNADLVNAMLGGLTQSHFDALYNRAYFSELIENNAFLNDVTITRATNFDYDKFLMDSYANYQDALKRYNLLPPPFTIGDSGVYGWNDGSAERLWKEYMPVTSSFFKLYNGIQTGDKSQMTWGAGLLLLDAASFGLEGTGAKILRAGLAEELAAREGLIGFVSKTLPQKIDDIAKIWGTKFPIQEMLEGRSFFEDIMGKYRYLKSAGWSHTGEISQYFKGVDFYKGTVVGDKIFAETAVSMKTTITTNVDTWLASAPIQKNIQFLKEALDTTKGLLSNGITMKTTQAEIHIYMPKANITTELVTNWMNKLNTVDSNIRFEIKAIEDFIH